MIGFQEGRHKNRLAQTTKGCSIFKNVIFSLKIDRKPVNVVSKLEKNSLGNRSKPIHTVFCKYFNILNLYILLWKQKVGIGFLRLVFSRFFDIRGNL